MSEKEDIERVVGALQSVPEKKLLIIEIANEAAAPSGELDYDKLIDRQPDVNLAVAEAKAYSNATQRAIKALADLPARQGGEQWEP